eukprot:TRINITY_DN12595_c0_g1_i3.p4 TRINITY_DN12595_c0_g1~~TRINITY_DN12595_c0_g1_i3.p4  ORF type:complete len:123 (-),score=38.43 TRINITY_DN12595_c0_g1_i3:81-449(-)
MQRGLVGSEMCIRDRVSTQSTWETAPVLTESNKKRVFLGLIIGGILFVALLIAIIVLIATADGYTPIPPKPKPVIVSINPYVLTTYYEESISTCLLYTSDAADDTPCVDLGGRRIIKKKKKI